MNNSFHLPPDAKAREEMLRKQQSEALRSTVRSGNELESTVKQTSSESAQQD